MHVTAFFAAFEVGNGAGSGVVETEPEGAEVGDVFCAD
jgi:hypothetical protein